jgi:hypothetical protein
MPGASNAAAIDNANDVVPITLAAGNTSIIGRGIVVLSAGAGTKVLKVKTTAGNDRVIPNCTDGLYIPGGVTMVYGSGDTSTVTSVLVLQ